MPTIIYHNHHIIPKHAGGTNAPDNIVRLTTTEHAEAHRLLYEKYGRWQDKLAWQGLAGFMGKEEIISQSTGRQKGCVPWNRGKIGVSEETLNKMKNRIITEETRKKMSDSAKIKVFTEEHRRKIGEASTNRVASDETRKKMSIAQKGRVFSEETKQKMREGQRRRRAK